MARDPLGRRPRPLSGRREPDYTIAATRDRETATRKKLKTIWIPYRPQQNVIGQMRAYIDGVADEESEIDGLCLWQDSQTGKSSTAKRLREELWLEAIARGETPNAYEIVIVGLDQRTSLKSVMQDILLAMDDPDWDYGTEKQLRERVRAFARRLGVKLIVIDECQHLHKGGNEVTDVTDAFKRVLDLGIAPLVLIGNLDADKVFTRNPQLRVRLGLPLRLPALDMKRNAEALRFRDFVVGYERAIAELGIFGGSSELLRPSTFDGLREASCTYSGRVARILKNAALHAAARDALMIEAYDLSHVVREIAIPARWIDHDPFSRPYD